MSKKKSKRNMTKEESDRVRNRHPSSEEEERAVEEDELESFRRRHRWLNEVLGEEPQPGADDDRGEDTSENK